jgi:hypothetical protein
MFGLRIVSKGELIMYAHEMKTLSEEKKLLTEELRLVRKECNAEIDKERRRADAAINTLLIKTNQVAITPAPTEFELDKQLEREAQMMDIFGERDEKKEKKDKETEQFLEELQSDRTK